LNFWSLIDEILNALLFLLIGLEVLLIPALPSYLWAGLLAIPVVLGARFISVGLPIMVLGAFRESTQGAVRVLTWGGLRGGISVALALSLPASPEKEVIVAICYAVVVFSIVVQGLTIGPLVRRVVGSSGDLYER
jgi:CPA1 family monovalent cation:H+ antiporter